MKKRVGTNIILSIGISIIWTYFCYSQMICNADDAATYTYFYQLYELGVGKSGIKEYLNPWFFSSFLAYKLGFGNTGIESSLIYLAIWYGICIFLTLYMIGGKEAFSWQILLASFILLPSSMTNKYHLTAIISTLMMIILCKGYIQQKKIWKLLFANLIGVYTILFSNDKMLFVLFLLSSIVLYVFIYILQKNSNFTKVILSILVLFVFFTVLKMFDFIHILKNGQPALDAWNGYGGSDYFRWTDIQTLFEKGIPSIFINFLQQWNVSPEGGVVQVNSFIWGVRIVLVLAAMGVLCLRWKQILKEGIDKLDFVDAVCTICTTSILLINASNGMLKYYELDNTPFGRYSAICWYLSVILLVRWLGEIFVRSKKNEKNNCFLISLICILAIIGNLEPTYFVKTEKIENDSVQDIDYLYQKSCKYGLADLWASHPITAYTNGEITVLPIWLRDDEKLDVNSCVYSDGGNQFNFFIEDKSYSLTLSKEEIDRVRGDYIDMYTNQDTIYLYDYDIRFIPKILAEVVGEDYSITEDLTYNIDLPVGTNRVEFTISNRDNIQLSLAENSNVRAFESSVKGENIIYADITCLQNTQVALTVSRKSDEYTGLRKIDVRRVYAAVDINENRIYLEPGNYIVTLCGENLTDALIKWDSDDITQITNGNLKRKYLVKITEPKTINFTNITQDVKIDRVYYENEVLFDIDEE